MPHRSQEHLIREGKLDASGWDGSGGKWTTPWPNNKLPSPTGDVTVATTSDTKVNTIDLLNAPSTGVTLVAVTFSTLPRAVQEGTLYIDDEVTPVVAGTRYLLAQLTNVTFTPNDTPTAKPFSKTFFYTHEDDVEVGQGRLTITVTAA